MLLRELLLYFGNHAIGCVPRTMEPVAGDVVDLVALAEVLNANGGVGGHVGYRRIVLSA